MRVISTIFFQLAAALALATHAAGAGTNGPADATTTETPAADSAWTNRLTVIPAEALGDFTLRWDDRGTLIRLADPAGTRTLVCTLKRRRSNWLGTPDTVFDARFAGGARVTAMLPNTHAVATFSLRRSRQRCVLAIDGQPALAFGDVWDGPIVVATPAASLPDTFEEGFVQRLGPFTFHDDFLVDKDAPEALQLWEPRSGQWGLQAVTGNVSGTLSRELKRFPKPERSPNFYSLQGQGTNAMILAGEPFYQAYAFRASVQHNAGTNGLLFLMRDGGPVRGHAFTVQTDPASGNLVFALWRGTSAGTDLGQPVEAVLSDRLPGQWMMLEVRVHEDLVVCLVDDIEVIRRRLALPPGGQFGLYSHAPGGARFDDITAASHTELPLETADDLAPWLRVASPGLTRVAGALTNAVWTDLPFSRQAHHRKSAGGQPVELILGATNDPPRRIDLGIMPQSADWSADLIAGWQGERAPHVRFTVRHDARQTVASLLHVIPGVTNHLLDRIELPPMTDAVTQLTLDATRADGILGRIDGRAAVWSAVADAAAGAAGYALGPDTRADVTLPLSRSEITRLTDLYEKNNIFVTDPYMRHWASPEGQWLGYPDRRAWYKSDVLRRVELRVPAINNTILHLLIPETLTNGTVQVAVTNDTILLSSQAATGTNRETVARVSTALFPESQPVANGPKHRFFTARLDDRIFTLSCDTGLIARCRIPLPFAGRRMMIEGMTTEQLAFTHVTREPVLDCLFTESLHDWLIGAGTWEVINRFQCTPDWSNMNGESAESLASLWSKYEIAGDFSIEFFAGMRHGWYERLGDLNLTVMNGADSAASGYTLVTAGWDPDQSQLWSRLFRDGSKMAESDHYTVPRFREGNDRRGYEPLVAAGRDIHGAWYTVRLRRLGNQLTFDFDNERILTVTDPDPIPRGSFGIWTYRNSMMVARVRVTADAIRPRPFAFAPIRLERPPAADAPAATNRPTAALTANGWPVQPLHPAYWHSADHDPHTRVTVRNGGSAPELTARTLQGGGDFLACADLPDIAADKLIGWRFEVARHPAARFNLEYEMGSGTGDTFKVVESLSHLICGTDDERGPRRLSGRINQPPPPTPDGADERLWTPVVAWIPIEGVAQQLTVRLTGFGNLQPSDVQQGLTGNPPGAWYAVRNFRPILRGVPELAADAAADVKDLQAALNAAPAGRLNTRPVPDGLAPPGTLLEWGVLPGSDIALLARPARRPPHGLRVASTLPWPNPLLTAKNVRIDEQPVPLAWIESNELLVPLPRGIPNTDRAVRLSLDLLDGRSFTQLFQGATLHAAFAKRQPPPPLLTAFDLTNSPACLQNFEARILSPESFRIAQPPTIRFDDPEQGCHLRFSNNGHSARLQGLLASGYDLARWPLLQFRYRGDPMARVSIHAVQSGVIRFSEPNPNASFVPLAPAPVLNHAWHTWCGRVSGFTLTRPVPAGYSLATTALRIGSLAGPDQTGRYSSLSVDDLAAGPAVGPASPLVFRTAFDAPFGLDVCAYAVARGPIPWNLRTPAQHDETVWFPCATNTWTEVPLRGIEDGVHHLVVRARSPGGPWSAVADLPILVDRVPIPITSEVARPARLNGTTFNINCLSGEGAPPRMETLSITRDGQPLVFARDATSLVHFRPDGIQLELNWPLLLRKAIQAATNGTTFNIRCEGLVDAAGNASFKHLASLAIDFAADQTPPACLPISTPTNALWWAPTLASADALQSFNRGLTINTGTSEDHFPFVGLKATERHGQVGRTFANPAWSPGRHRYLALSLRLAPDTTSTTNLPLFELLFRPPKLPAGGKKLQRGGYRLTVKRETVADNQILFGQVAWEPGRWNDLIIDVAALMQRESGLTKPFDLQDFVIGLPASSPYAIQIRAGAILSAWAPNDRVVYRAYDASGIAGATWQGGGQAAQTAIFPARINLPPDDPCWLKIIFRDRPGNATTPFLLPIPPHPPLAGNLPVAEDWNE